MFAWLNFSSLVASSFVFTIFYVKSAGPAALAKRIGSSAYRKCMMYRVISSVFMFVASANYILYYWFPLPLPLSRTLPWPRWVSAVVALVIAVPSLYLMIRGVIDAGEETVWPRPEHTLYGGIYTRIRHPQAVGELPLWWVLALFVHSPFLVLYSFVYIPVWYYLCVAEEHDLLIRYGTAYEVYRKKTGFWFPKSKKEDRDT